jgi:hypothetical protein
MLLTSGNSPDSTARGCANRFRISKSKSGLCQQEHSQCARRVHLLILLSPPALALAGASVALTDLSRLDSEKTPARDS